MSEYIKIPVTARMEKDYKECVDMQEIGKEKDCSECSLNGGDWCECLGEYTWCKED